MVGDSKALAGLGTEGLGRGGHESPLPEPKLAADLGHAGSLELTGSPDVSLLAPGAPLRSPQASLFPMCRSETQALLLLL